MTVSLLDPRALADAVPRLASLLVDCVAGGASVGFLPPMARTDAIELWINTTRQVERGITRVLAATDGEAIIGVVILMLSNVPNGAHRGAVHKLLVDPPARRRGVAAALMHAVELEARACKRSLLVLDTARGGDAERLYRRLGWNEVGVIPGYALVPGGANDTVLFWKRV